MESWVQSWRPRTNAFCYFSSPSVQTTAPATKKWCQVIRSAAPVTQNHLSKPEDLILQNATPLRKSVPGPPSISDEHVSCTAKCIFADPLQMSHACHRFWNCYKTLASCKTTKVLRTPQCFPLLTLKCASRQNGVHCTFSTSQLLQVLRSWGVLYILTSKCASRHNGEHFLDISTSKSGPSLLCF